MVISHNNSQPRELKDDIRRTRDDNRTSKPARDRVEDKRKSLEYSSGLAKRFRSDEEDLDFIFTMPQEKIFVELKDENVFRQPRPINVPEHMKTSSNSACFTMTIGILLPHAGTYTSS